MFTYKLLGMHETKKVKITGSRRKLYNKYRRSVGWKVNVEHVESDGRCIENFGRVYKWSKPRVMPRRNF
jgi:hypothetical protein